MKSKIDRQNEGVVTVRKALKFALAVLLFLGDAFFILTERINAPETLDLLTAFIVTLIVPVLGVIPFRLYDCFVLCTSLIIIIVRFHVVRYTTSLFLLVYMVLLCLILWLKTGKFGEHGIGVFFVVLIGTTSIELYYATVWKFLDIYYRLGRKYNWKVIEKALFLLFCCGVFLVLFIALLKLISLIFKRWRDVLDTFSLKFHNLEVYVLMLTAFMLTCLTLINLFFPHDDGSLIYERYFRRIYFAVFAILLLVEIVFVCLLLRTVSIREKMTAAENDKNLIAAYNSQLEDNLESMQEVRHDVKNLFLTMSGFVERSEDEEMKRFYRENIVPFVEDSLVRNELSNSLRALSNDSLKAFLYYKIIEITSRGVRVSVEITSPLAECAGGGDFVRVIGILLDNAAEEAALILGGGVKVKISEDDGSFYVKISNACRKEVRERGVIPGTTGKGLGRGKGLLILEKIISRYDNIVLSSFFTEDEFVQLLTIAK